MSNYSNLSQELTKQLSKAEKKNQGIYFTPPSTVKYAISLIKPFIEDGTIRNILEPSCGSGEFVLPLRNMFPDIPMTAVEYNETIYDGLSEVVDPHVQLFHGDYLTHPSGSNKYGLIIGNPPYFVMKKKDVPSTYHSYFEGRPNIFILFILRALQSLDKNGILLFVLPKNFLNCLYYDKTRKHIIENYTLLSIYECNDQYLETKQDTVIMMVQNTQDKEAMNDNPYCMNLHTSTIFGTSETICELKMLFENTTTLNDMKFKVSVGNVVWNQCKSILTDDASKTRLIYSSDIKDKKLIMKSYTNPEKKNYIEKSGSKEPVLVLNRGYGVGTYNFEYCLIEGGFDYLIENHLICIRCVDDTIHSNEDIIKRYKIIMKSFDDNRTKKFIKLFCSNNALNTTELQNILPIFVSTM